MTAYLIRRLLLMIPTLIGILTLSFFIFEFVPGGPIDQIRAMLEGRGTGAGEVSLSTGTGATKRKKVDPKLEMRLVRQFGYNQSRLTRYLRTLLWYGADSVLSSREIEEGSVEIFHHDGRRCLMVQWQGQMRAYENRWPLTDNGLGLTLDREKGHLVSIADGSRFDPLSGKALTAASGKLKSLPLRSEERDDYREFYVKESFWGGLLNWDNWHGVFLLKFGNSIHYNKTVVELIGERLPVSMSLGIFSFFSTYLVCILLGIAKAVRNGQRFDTLTSAVILLGYSIPGFILAILLIVYFGPGEQHLIHLIPIDGGLSSSTVQGYSQWSAWAKLLDYFHHLAAPVLCMSVGSFAVLTMLTKNSVLDQIHQLYAVAARARGLSERAVLYKHVLRNSLIPLVTGFPSSFLGMFFTGALLLEKVFNLNGMGLLSYEAVMQRDFPLMIGSLFIFTILKLVGILLTDLAYVVVDPRISFGKSVA